MRIGAWHWSSPRIRLVFMGRSVRRDDQRRYTPQSSSRSRSEVRAGDPGRGGRRRRGRREEPGPWAWPVGDQRGEQGSSCNTRRRCHLTSSIGWSTRTRCTPTSWPATSPAATTTWACIRGCCRRSGRTATRSACAATDPRVQFDPRPRRGHDGQTILYTPFGRSITRVGRETRADPDPTSARGGRQRHGHHAASIHRRDTQLLRSGRSGQRRSGGRRSISSTSGARSGTTARGLSGDIMAELRAASAHLCSPVPPRRPAAVEGPGRG